MIETLKQFDTGLFLNINGHAGSWLDYFLGWPTYLGEIYFFMPLVLLFMLIWDDPKKIPRRFTEILACILLAGLLNHILKDCIARPRPAKFFYDAIDQGKVTVNFLFAVYTSKSFPSGHTANFFALALALTHIYGKKFIWVYLFAAWIGITRIYTGAHFPSDVLGGAVVGIICAAIGLWLLQKLRNRFI